MTDHKLTAAGAAFTADFHRIDPTSTAGTGHAVCHCGELSPELTSGRARKAWFAEHKKQVEADDFSDVDERSTNLQNSRSEDEIQAELDAQAEARAEKSAQQLEDEHEDLYAGLESDPQTQLTEDIVDAAEADPESDHVKVEVKDGELGDHFWTERTLRGNYSIEIAPAFEQMAALSGLEASIKIDSAVLRHASVEGPRAEVEAFLARFDKFNAEWPTELKAWQATTVEQRRGMTDMQKFVAHREHIRTLVKRETEAWFK